MTRGQEDKRMALIIGGTRGIGAATFYALQAHGWIVAATGKESFEVRKPQLVPSLSLPQDSTFDALIFCAGDVYAQRQNAFDFPICFYDLIIHPNWNWHLNQGCVIVAVSSVAAERPAKVNPHYAAAKAALESYARTIADSEMAKTHGWRVEVIRFDLVDTDMLKQLPPETLKGREIISAEVAARRILTLMGVEL